MFGGPRRQVLLAACPRREVSGDPWLLSDAHQIPRLQPYRHVRPITIPALAGGQIDSPLIRRIVGFEPAMGYVSGTMQG